MLKSSVSDSSVFDTQTSELSKELAASITPAQSPISG